MQIATMMKLILIEIFMACSMVVKWRCKMWSTMDLIISFTRFVSTSKFQNKSQVVELKAMAKCME
jgi:hypothetical protein